MSRKDRRKTPLFAVARTFLYEALDQKGSSPKPNAPRKKKRKFATLNPKLSGNILCTLNPKCLAFESYLNDLRYTYYSIPQKFK